MYQNFEDQLLYPSIKVQFYSDIYLVISFYFYCHYFRIKYSYYFRNYLRFSIDDDLLLVLQKVSEHH